MRFQKYWNLIYERRMLILLFVAVCVAISACFTYVIIPPKYRATVKIVIVNESISKSEPAMIDQSKLESMVKTDQVATLAMNKLKSKNISSESIHKLIENIEVYAGEQGTVGISVSGSNPVECEKTANAFSEAFLELTNKNSEDFDKSKSEIEKSKIEMGQIRKEIEEQLLDDGANTRITERLKNEKRLIDKFVNIMDEHYSKILKYDPKQTVKIYKKADVPAEPFFPDRKKALAIGIVIGLLLGIGAVYLLEEMENESKNEALRKR